MDDGVTSGQHAHRPAHQAPHEARAGLDARTDPAAERVKAARRARHEARQQAVAVRRPWHVGWFGWRRSGDLGAATTWADRRAWAAWADGPRSRWVGLAILTVVALVVWVEVAAVGRPSEQAELQGGAAARATDATLASPTPLAELPTPTGPAVSIGMVEANGPVAGCTLHAPLADFRARVGPEIVGDCVDAAQAAADGDVRQRTTHGEGFWRAADQRMAFTDGAQTWLAAPTGIVRRRNSERFAWEPDADAGPRPARTARVQPPAQAGSILPARRIVSYYGNPLSSSMGVLGEMPPEKLFPRLNTQAAAYKAADSSRPVVPALELVAVVAQADAGPDGLYRLRMDTELIERVARWADEQGYLLILDVQTGLGDVDEEVRWLLPFLRRPNVHLALDPEFAMPAGQVTGKRVGTMDAAAINGVLRTLAELVEAENLPPKLLVVHRFTEEMVTHTEKIANDPRVQVVMVMDGFGGPAVKSRQYDELIVQPGAQYTGFKLFYRHDEPLMTPQQVLLLDPAPDLIIYQ